MTPADKTVLIAGSTDGVGKLVARRRLWDLSVELTTVEQREGR